jgi:hypothetical protein
MTDRFKDSTGRHNQSNEYWRIVEEIQMEICKKYPEMTGGLVPVVLNRKDWKYVLLYGLIQSGKSPAIIALVWILNFVYFERTVVITKTLDSLRADLMMKFDDGFLNTIIDSVCNQHNLNAVEKSYFKISTFNYQSQKKSALVNAHTWKAVPILLLQKDNYKALSHYYFRVAAEPNTVINFIIDECHLLYPNMKQFMENRGLSGKTVGGREILHWMHRKCRNNRARMWGLPQHLMLQWLETQFAHQITC